MCNDYANIQIILEEKNTELNILSSDISNLLEDNRLLKKDKNQLELTVNNFSMLKQI